MGDPSDLTGTDRYVVAISDVHLGTDGPTVWYQRHLHEPYLLRLLEWVATQADHIAELVLLGDIVDLWTYPADEVPPTFADIVACHPAVLGPDGAIARVLDALDGRVSYLAGNHDMGITADDVALLASPGGHHVVLREGGESGRAPYVPVEGIGFTHGHEHTLFNAPDDVAPWAPLPLGYFVTRAVATGAARLLEPGQTVAELANQGSPNGIDLQSLVGIAGGLGARSVGAAVIDLVCAATGFGLDDQIAMPDGSTVTMREARAAHADVWTRWSDRHGGGRVGHANAVRAAIADFDGSHLGWAAQRVAFEHDLDLIVMGHTHLPISGLDGSMVDYVNSGFDCPSGPDLDRADEPQHVTFAVIDTSPDLEARTSVRPHDDRPFEGRIWAVGEVDCAPVEAPRTSVVHGASVDYSCYVVVDNEEGAADLELVSCEAVVGSWVVPPPPKIPAGTEGRFWLQDLLGPSGSAGTATYRRVGSAAHEGEELLELAFACPVVVGTNAASGTSTLRTRTGDGPWRDDRVALWGHPFSVAFTVR